MDDIKVQNFLREHPGAQFPHYRQLSEQEAEKLRRRLCLRLGLPPETSPLDLVHTLFNRSAAVPHVDAEDENFSLRTVLREVGIEPDSKVFVNWHRFDQIDEFSLDGLAKRFVDIWYPATDDIDIFDEGLEWVLSVGYSGTVRVLKI